MRSPFNYKSFLLLGIGAGIFAGASVVSTDPKLASAQLALYVIAMIFVGAALLLSFYNSITYRREVEAPTLETGLEPEEQILRCFPGGYSTSRFSASVGKWCITNKRLVYEGSKPQAFGKPEPDYLSFPLNELANVELVDAGRLNKYVEVATKPGEKVQILCRKREEFIDALKKAASLA